MHYSSSIRAGLGHNKNDSGVIGDISTVNIRFFFYKIYYQSENEAVQDNLPRMQSVKFYWYRNKKNAIVLK